MSECVVRMEMPKNCAKCPISYQAYGDLCWCKLAFEKNEAVIGGLMWKTVNPDTRPDWCPIICALPEGHGRLVDGDKLKHASTDGRKWCDPCPVWGEIYMAETIVPAEAERSET